MTIRSLIQEMRSRPHRVVHEAAASSSTAPGSEPFRWSELPDELLREILIRVESADGGDWPSRRSVVACAGVCRVWRMIVKEIVAVPEVSSKLTFPISLEQPGPRGSLVQCFIKRNRNTQSYHLYLGLTNSLTDNGKFLLAACKLKRATCTDYIISLRSDDMSRRSNAYLGRVRSNFIGTKFTVFQGNLMPQRSSKMVKSRSSNLMKVSPRAPSGSYPVAHVSYELNVLGSRGPRRMRCIMDTLPMSLIDPRGAASSTTPFFRSHSSSNNNNSRDPPLVLSNKTPRWHEQLRCWCLNFHGRVTVASVKNFQLVSVGDRETGQASEASERIILQFGKVGKDMFTMDYGYPISAFQAFAICLSSFETRIACE
ncbi:Tubby-like F-box protein 9 [Raphanus sativus]|uniref:Tubby-like F-box protein 9 n=1 Tax=Raphanus sativus TaxID=3726 RepID=A0A6J0LSZ6_RAPSA|nr:tubby-like F-box protein 9 [Raphanus sativus]KAJ4893019.1 Tubby-like F-box protein 9 [Raphanus sativus]